MGGQVIHNADIEFPGYISVSKGLTSLPAAGLIQILVFCGLVEMAWWPASKYDGDYGVGFFGAKYKDPAVRTQKLQAEMANGRFALLAVAGNMFQEGQTGLTMGEWMGSFGK